MSTKIQCFAMQCPLFWPSHSGNGCRIARSIGYTPGFGVKVGPNASYEGFSIFYNFSSTKNRKNCIRLQDLVIFELGFGFLMQNSIYGQMETPGNHQLGLRTEKTEKHSEI